MSEQELKLINFITHLPSNVNPYYATANMLEAITHSPLSQPWSRRLRIVGLVFTEIMFFQSTYLMYLRFRINQTPKIKCNNLGLVVVNISITSAIAYFIYSILTIYVLLTRIVLDMGRSANEAELLLVFGLKFIAVILGSWSFCWVCACQCAKILWDSDLASKYDRDMLKNFIKWTFSTLFICVAVVPFFPIAYKYISAYRALREIESIVHDITSKLRLKGESYDPNNFSQIGLLSLLLPAKKLIPLQDRMERGLREGQYLYFTDLALLSFAYMPLLTISLRALYKQSVSQAALDAALGSASGQQSHVSPVSNRIRHQRQRLVYHSIAVYIATSLHIPMIFYQMLVSRSRGFTKKMEWQEVTFQGMTFPLSIAGNIILLILNFHSYLTLQEKERRKSGNPGKSVSTDHLGSTLIQRIHSYGLGYIRSKIDEDVVELGELATHEIDRTISSKDALVSKQAPIFDSSDDHHDK